MENKDNHTRWIKQVAAEEGFDACGIAAAVRLDEDARRLESWLHQGLHGGMKYMENHFDLRVDPTRLVPGARSVITLLKNYFPEKEMTGDWRISKYAYGEDYHEVIRGRLNALIARMQEKMGSFQGRGFVDSAPVLERTWAQRSGLGWIGRNGNLITRGGGSFFFIATLIVDRELAYDDPFAKDYCGSCRKCIDACPTGAILPDKTVNGSQCISYFTIELKDALIPEEMKGRFQNWMFGCDTCQDVCPWNRFSRPHHESAFQPLPQILNLSTREWEEMTEDSFRTVFRRSPLRRSKYDGIRRNIRFLKTETGL